MSLKEQDRATLVVLGLEKSDKMLDAANWLIVVMGTDSGYDECSPKMRIEKRKSAASVSLCLGF